VSILTCGIDAIIPVNLLKDFIIMHLFWFN